MEKKEAQLIGLKMESCTVCNKTQPIYISFLELEREEGLWEETGAEDSPNAQTACSPPSLTTSHTILAF